MNNGDNMLISCGDKKPNMANKIYTGFKNLVHNFNPITQKNQNAVQSTNTTSSISPIHTPRNYNDVQNTNNPSAIMKHSPISLDIPPTQNGVQQSANKSHHITIRSPNTNATINHQFQKGDKVFLKKKKGNENVLLYKNNIGAYSIKSFENTSNNKDSIIFTIHDINDNSIVLKCVIDGITYYLNSLRDLTINIKDNTIKNIGNTNDMTREFIVTYRHNISDTNIIKLDTSHVEYMIIKIPSDQ